MRVSATSNPLVRFGAYVLDPLRHVLQTPGGEVQLSPLASRLICLLAAEPGAIVDRGKIIDDLWRGDWLVGDPALSRVVSEIRRATGEDKSNPTLIQNVPRRGYRLLAPQSAPGGHAQPIWPRAWALANRTLLIVIGGLALLLLLAIAARNLR